MEVIYSSLVGSEAPYAVRLCLLLSPTPLGYPCFLSGPPVLLPSWRSCRLLIATHSLFKFTVVGFYWEVLHQVYLS